MVITANFSTGRNPTPQIGVIALAPPEDLTF